ncbi:hypothetical protein BXZ70DRAFT_929208 [Cristinia sonorae]|uniref:DUF7053 domain-containing protein n=1 Tax=Cristinia sonorae TaxID=1940300 RepID=A0A8K0URS0_9AGAR|nr:hypothetical protein BXZ70DRAFT_929208 [Cristinia sonorae]
MGVLDSTRKVSFSRTVDCTFEKAINTLHNPTTLIDLNPLVIHREQDPTNPNIWHIRDRLKINVGLTFEWNLDYRANVTPLDDGLEFDVSAPLGTTLKNRWTVLKVEGGVKIMEDVTATTNFLLISATMRDLLPAHEDLHNKLAAMLEGRSLASSQATTGTPERSIQRDYNLLIFASLVAIFCFYTTWTKPALLALLSALLFLGVIMPGKEPYSAFNHQDLNKRGDHEDAPQTEWLNMGFWKDTTVFPRACEALALKLIAAAQCQVNGNVLDVGHGSGESLLLHLRHPSVPRPSHITGITSLEAHYTRSLERVKQCQADLGVADKVTLYHGDAVYRPTDKKQDYPHPLNPTSRLRPFTTILALDCAFHFRTRHDFLVQSYTRLAPGGRIALADICFSRGSGWKRGVVRRLVGLLGVMPAENMITVCDYVRDMEVIGYEDVVVEDITEDVFPGLIKFLGGREIGWKVFARMMGLLPAAGARFVIISGRR